MLQQQRVMLTLEPMCGCDALATGLVGRAITTARKP